MKTLLSLAAISGFLGVAFGAFGAHALRDKLTEAMMHTYEKAVLYQFVHTGALLACAILVYMFPGSKMFSMAGWAFLAGIVVFSGSLYAYTLTDTKAFAMVTPIGGLLFLAGWVLLLWGAMKLSSATTI